MEIGLCKYAFKHGNLVPANQLAEKLQGIELTL